MNKEKWYVRFLKKIGVIKSEPISKEQIKDMCNRAVQSGVCPKSCESCAWGMMLKEE
ncbi:MAG: hypothetical protein NC243_12255 [Lachnoclostridium sp.]|nr:hypothetical protein [Lachnoclostridium sp.]MCM1385298.1 hypothetical protein [Lachnoclostridium sp.]